MTALQAARMYRGIGFNPLPCCSTRKMPALKSWAHLRHEVGPDEWLEDWPTQNIQVVCGAAWGLAVIDSDGLPGLLRFRSMVEDGGGLPATWVVATPGGGFHHWFLLPEHVVDMPSGFLWRGAGKHEAVEVLADGKLVVAPPSRFGQKNAYRFLTGPADGVMSPTPMPPWLLEACGILRRRSMEYVPRRPGPSPRHDDLRFDLDEVHAAIPDLLAEAESVGLRVAHRGSGTWAVAHAIDRDDTRPSASVNKGTGYYHDFASGEKLPFFSLLAALDPNRHPTWVDAVNYYGDRYGVPPRVRRHNFQLTA